MQLFDMTSVGKKCGERGIFDEKAGHKCFKDLGFTDACATIWNYDAIFDGKACGGICLKDLKQPYNLPAKNCSINDCLQCDEDKAGPVFKQVAGRTRRRSGLESAIQRPCKSVAKLKHDACPHQ
jgi:hypothetical protein